MLFDPENSQEFKTFKLVHFKADLHGLINISVEILPLLAALILVTQLLKFGLQPVPCSSAFERQQLCPFTTSPSLLVPCPHNLKESRSHHACKWLELDKLEIMLVQSQCC